MKKQIKRIVVILYLVALSIILFCRKPDGLGIGLSQIAMRLQTSVNLRPLKTLDGYFSAIAFGGIGSKLYCLNIYGNVLLFCPLGVIFSRKLKVFPSILSLLAAIISAELLQLVFGVGRADIDDVILNFVGALLGYVIARAVRKIKPS